jgi:hypothetical protein
MFVEAKVQKEHSLSPALQLHLLVSTCLHILDNLFYPLFGFYSFFRFSGLFGLFGFFGFFGFYGLYGFWSFWGFFGSMLKNED